MSMLIHSERSQLHSTYATSFISSFHRKTPALQIISIHYFFPPYSTLAGQRMTITAWYVVGDTSLSGTSQIPDLSGFKALILLHVQQSNTYQWSVLINRLNDQGSSITIMRCSAVSSTRGSIIIAWKRNLEEAPSRAVFDHKESGITPDF